jgi:hypothetical protein
MRLATPITIKAVGQLEAGELVIWSGLDVQSKAIVLLSAKQNNGNTMLGILESVDSARDVIPHWRIAPNENHKSISFGRDWIVVPDLVGVYAGKYYSYEKRPALYVVEQGTTLLQLRGGPDGRDGDFLFDLSVAGDSKFNSIPEASVGFPSWAIWLSEEDRSRPGAVPFFEARPPAATEI